MDSLETYVSYQRLLNNWLLTSFERILLTNPCFQNLVLLRDFKTNLKKNYLIDLEILLFEFIIESVVVLVEVEVLVQLCNIFPFLFYKYLKNI